MKSGGFHRVIFICHSPQVWEMADRVLRVEASSVFVEGRRPDGVHETELARSTAEKTPESWFGASPGP